MTLDHALRALDLGRYTEAQSLVDIVREATDGSTRVRAQLALARLHRERAMFSEARRVVTAALKQDLAVAARRDALVELGLVELDAGELARAHEIFGEAGRLLSEEVSASTEMRHLAGHLAWSSGDKRGALREFKAVLDSKSLTSRARIELELHACDLLAELDERDEAARLLLKARSDCSAALGSSHWLLAVGMMTESGLRQREGRYQQALTLAERAVALDEEKLGPTHLRTFSDRARVATLVAGQGRPIEGSAMLEGVIQDVRSYYGFKSDQLVSRPWVASNAAGEARRGRTHAV